MSWSMADVCACDTTTNGHAHGCRRRDCLKCDAQGPLVLAGNSYFTCVHCTRIAPCWKPCTKLKQTTLTRNNDGGTLVISVPRGGDGDPHPA